MIKKIILFSALAVFILITGALTYKIGTAVHVRQTIDQVPLGYSLGPPNADISLVEFSVYSCPHCRNIHNTVLRAVIQDGNVLYVPRPLWSGRVEDAHMAYAAGLQEEFLETHTALLQDPRLLDEGGLMAIAEDLGLDTERLQEDMQSKEVMDRVNENNDLFLALGGERTPTFIIGKKIFFVPEGQMPTVQDFLEMFQEARQ